MTDNCPRCLRPGVPPVASRARGDRVVHGYRCPCGHQWITGRHLPSYPQPGANALAA